VAFAAIDQEPQRALSVSKAKGYLQAVVRDYLDGIFRAQPYAALVQREAPRITV